MSLSKPGSDEWGCPSTAEVFYWRVGCVLAAVLVLLVLAAVWLAIA